MLPVTLAAGLIGCGKSEKPTAEKAQDVVVPERLKSPDDVYHRAQQVYQVAAVVGQLKVGGEGRKLALSKLVEQIKSHHPADRFKLSEWQWNRDVHLCDGMTTAERNTVAHAIFGKEVSDATALLVPPESDIHMLYKAASEALKADKKKMADEPHVGVAIVRSGMTYRPLTMDLSSKPMLGNGVSETVESAGRLEITVPNGYPQSFPVAVNDCYNMTTGGNILLESGGVLTYKRVAFSLPKVDPKSQRLSDEFEALRALEADLQDPKNPKQNLKEHKAIDKLEKESFK